MAEGDKVTLAGVVTYDNPGNDWVEIEFAEGALGRALVPRSSFDSASDWWGALCTDLRKPLEWLRRVHRHADRPPQVQRDVLVALAVHFVDWDSGEGFASIEELADFCGASRSTVQRSLRWALRESLLIRLRRGHRVFDGGAKVSQWQLW